MSDIDNTTPATEPGIVATPLTVRDIVPISNFDQLPDIHEDDVLVVQDVSVPAYRKLTLSRLLSWLTVGFRQMAFDSAHPAYDPDTGYGDIYVQYPVAYDMDTHTIQYNAPEPAQLYNRNGIQSTWVELDFDGAFFRANGGLSQNFDGQTKPQAEELPNIVGSTYQKFIGWHNGRTSTTGALTYTEIIENTAPTTSAGGNAGVLGINASKTTGTGNGVYKDNGHVTPTNFTIRVWLRTA